jgi:hypothetical protein
MGLIISSKQDNKITITGTVIEIPSVYARLEFAGRADGITLEIAAFTYASLDAYHAGASILSTSVPQGNITVEIDPTEVQGLDTAHKYSKIAFENAGYDVIIDIN